MVKIYYHINKLLFDISIKGGNFSAVRDFQLIPSQGKMNKKHRTAANQSGLHLKSQSNTLISFP